MRDNSRLTFKPWQVLVSPLLLTFALLLFISPVAAQTTPRSSGGATTTTQTFADGPADVVKNLGTQGYYVSLAVKANITNESNLEKDVAATVKKLKDNKHDTRIAVLGNVILMAAKESQGGNPIEYANFLQGYLSSPKPESVVVVDANKKSVGLSSDKLTAAESQQVINDSLSTFNTKGFAAGAALVAENAAAKIDSKAKAVADKADSDKKSSMITTLLIVLVVIAVIGGGLAFMYFNTRSWLKQRVAELQGLAGQVSNQVLTLSETIAYLPDAVRSNTNNIFTQASSSFSNANTSLRQLEKANPWAVIFQRGKYANQFDMTANQLQTSRNAMVQVQQTVDNNTHMS
ncbi:MAG: hypothetical protein HXX20_01020 [Chloroflexi bacterium]|nr:hypothetical protein [Chloroflexota bacterium]